MSVADDLLDGVPTGLWLGGKQVPSSDGTTFAVHDPATGAELADVADATPEDARSALDAAAAVQSAWAATPARVRAEILRRAWQLLADRGLRHLRAPEVALGRPWVRLEAANPPLRPPT